MKPLARNLSALTILFTTGHGAADVIYSGYQNITIPTTYAGTYIDVHGMTSSSSAFTGWDINPFMGGVYLSNSAEFQPARSGTGGMDTVLKFATGDTISATGLNFATGSSGSMTHLGTQFTAGQEGYLGFKLDSTTNYGWMRVVFTNNASGAVVKDWAYDNSTSAAITTGNIVQSAPSAGAQTVTLTSDTGKSFTLGTQITNSLGNAGGVTNSVIKEGAGTAILTGTNSYSGTTAINAGVLSIAASASTGSGDVTVNNALTKLMGTGTIGGNTTVNSGAILAPGNAGVGKVNFSGDLTASSGSIFEWELAATPAETGRGTSYDAVNVAGTMGGSGAIFRVVLDGAQNFSESFWDTNRTWTNIFTAADNTTAKTNWTNAFSSVQYYNITTGSLGTPTGQGSFTMSGSSLTWTAVPEPTTALAGILLGTGLLRRRRG
jgi:autotransporter-associated beta strand protein